MGPGALPGDVVPDLAEEAGEVLLGDAAFLPLLGGGLAVAPGLPLHEDVLNLGLDDGPGLVGLAQEEAGAVRLEGGVGLFVPDDGVQVVKAQLPAPHLDVGVKGKDQVPPEALPGHGHVPHHDDEPPPGHQKPKDLPPDPVQLVQKGLVVLNVAHLAGHVLIALQGPVGG